MTLSSPVQSSLGPIALAAGGTGGHLFPAQALAQELARRGRSVVLMTDERVLKFETLFPGVPIYAVPAATFSGHGVGGKIKAGLAILSGTWQAYRLLGRLKPAAMIGFGGYPTMPPMLAALVRRIPACVHEQNAVLGRVNRVVAPYVTAIASTFSEPRYLRGKDGAKLVVTGNPVRDAVVAQGTSVYRAPQGDGPIRLLVFGGSQGARVLSDVVPSALTRLPEALRVRLQVVQQCRQEDIDRVRQTYDAADISTEIASFFDDMPVRIAQAHLVIGRSGASTISELSVIGRPSILVPLPHSLDNDQKANAAFLADAGAAWMIEQKDFTPDAVAGLIGELCGAPGKLETAAAAARRQGRPHAVRDLADLVERLSAYSALPEEKIVASADEGGRGTLFVGLDGAL